MFFESDMIELHLHVNTPTISATSQPQLPFPVHFTHHHLSVLDDVIVSASSFVCLRHNDHQLIRTLKSISALGFFYTLRQKFISQSFPECMLKLVLLKCFLQWVDSTHPPCFFMKYPSCYS